MPNRQLPDKLFFRIGEVAAIVGVKAHVLRYWESEFNCLKPMKTRGSHRQYRRRDVELALIIRELLHEEGYTIQGARRKLRLLGYDRRSSAPPAEISRELRLRATLLSIRAELESLRDALDAVARESEEEGSTAVTVHRASPAPATVRALARSREKE